jgi:phosphatidylglycerophosphate synthase
MAFFDGNLQFILSSDPSRTPLKVKPTQISKLNTVFQFGTIGGTLALAAFDDITSLASLSIGSLQLNLVSGMCYITSATTILSGLSYLDGKSMVKRKDK